MVLAVYYPGTLEIARELGDRLAGKVVVDISNPLNQTFDGLATAPGTSAAEEVAATMPAGKGVVKAFNTTFSGTLVEGQVAGQPLDVFIAGDDEEARETVAQLVRDGGLRAIDVGALEREAAGGFGVFGDHAAAATGAELPERLEAPKLGGTRIHQDRRLDEEEEHYAAVRGGIPEDPRKLLHEYIDQGRLGVKGGRGFYEYTD